MPKNIYKISAYEMVPTEINIDFDKVYEEQTFRMKNSELKSPKTLEIDDRVRNFNTWFDDYLDAQDICWFALYFDDKEPWGKTEEEAIANAVKAYKKYLQDKADNTSKVCLNENGEISW